VPESSNLLDFVTSPGDEAMSAPTSRRFGPYEVISPLGAGGMGEVFRARDTRLGRFVAIKVLPPAFSIDPIRLRRFEQEAQAAAALNHPAILAIFDIGTTDDGVPYIVSELLEGSTLGHCIRTSRLPLRTVIDYALQIARGLGAAHDKGIVHRDLKPDNVFVTREGHIKILDFGLAKLLEPPQSAPNDQTISIHHGRTLPGVVLGTVGYMSPEQVRGLPTDYRTDIFSFGVILYEMLAGKPAFKAVTDADTQAAILKEEPPHFSITTAPVPPALEQIVWHCLEKDPHRRFQSASDIAFSLQGLSTTSSLSSAGGTEIRSPKFRRWRTVLLAVLAAVAVVFGALRIGQKMEHTPPRYQQLTYQQGVIASAKFSPDGQTVICAARFSNNYQIYSIRFDSAGIRPLDIHADQVVAVSSKGDLAVLESSRVLEGSTVVGLLVRIPLGGGAPKKILNDVRFADWSRDGSELAIAHFIPEKHAFRLEFPIGNVLYETAGWIDQPRLSPDGQSIALIDHPVFGDDQGYVALVPSSGGNIQRLTRLWGDMRGLAWHPGGELWFTATDVGFNYSLFAANQSGKTRHVLTVPGGLLLDDIASNGTVLLTHSMERTLVMVSTRQHPDEQNLGWLENTEFFRFSDDGTQILLGDQSSASGNRHASFLRNVDGSPAVRVGDGDGIALSPDGEWVLSRIPPNQLVLLPTGAGELRRLAPSGPSADKADPPKPAPTIRADLPAEWFPDGKRIAYIGDDNRTHVLDLNGTAVALTPVGTTGYLVSRDGQHVLVQTSTNAFQLFPVSQGDPKPLDFLNPTDRPIRFSADGRDLFVETSETEPPGSNFYRLNLANGHRTLLWHIQSPRSNVANGISLVDVTPDGAGYAYGYRQKSTVLYAVEGLK
jgi:eukaryotic-like serine/threonine-protein kinase